MPKLGKREDVSGMTPAQGVKRARVGLMLGCVQREFLPEINAATVRVLAAEGCEVVAPGEQPCCGALLMHSGKDEEARALARRMFATFEKAGVDVIITNAGGCGSHLKDFAAEEKGAFKGTIKDVAEFLVELGPRAERHAVAKRVAYHDSCHLQHAQKVRTQPRQLLAGIPGLTLAEMPEGTLCCGSAGIYNLVQPETANALGDRKAKFIQAIAPDAVATGNVGCILQMQAALDRQANGKQPPVVHTIQLLDESIRGRARACDSCPITISIWARWRTRKCLRRDFIPISRRPSPASKGAAGATGRPRRDRGVRDLRSLLWSSIDNDTSRDLDQAEVAERVSGGIRVMVAIADVDSDVPMGSPVDQHAAERDHLGLYRRPNLSDAAGGAFNRSDVAQRRRRPSGDCDRLASWRPMAQLHRRASIARWCAIRRSSTYNGVGAWLEGTAPAPPKVAASADLAAQLKLQDEAAQILLDERASIGRAHHRSRGNRSRWSPTARCRASTRARRIAPAI